MEDKKMYMVANCAEEDNLSLFMWSEEELQSMTALFTRMSEQDKGYAPMLYIYQCKEDVIIPLEEVKNQDWFKNEGYSIDELDVFKLDKHAYTWNNRWSSIYDLSRVWPYEF